MKAQRKCQMARHVGQNLSCLWTAFLRVRRLYGQRLNRLQHGSSATATNARRSTIPTALSLATVSVALQEFDRPSRRQFRLPLQVIAHTLAVPGFRCRQRTQRAKRLVQALRFRPIEFARQALEAESMIAIGVNLTGVLESRLSLAASRAHLPDPP